MKTFTAVLCLAACMAAVFAAEQDDDLDKQWAEHKQAILNRLKDHQSTLEKQLEEQLKSLESLSGDDKDLAQREIDELKVQIERTKYQINKLGQYKN
ncbi:hypothetical protein GE061_011252 [Apolygus lucorum]|uniref:Uncharacterized protein n=1 Tax=Apolygus lucorum TaxID=248454 RepID=A0A6A4JVP9_APOLU|nr:hypothetical protein GE061_011252 [Apolygus lucorum]